MSEVRIEGDRLLIGDVRVTFHRTLRIPEDGTHPLPPGLGAFPIRRVADYAGRLPAEWVARGGVLLPMYAREAMWLGFSAPTPAALTVAVGKVNAVSGKPYGDQLSDDPQSYVPLPRQPWLDGINAGDGFIRQFVAMPLGMGYTVEGQVTGEETVGGLQLAVHAPTAANLEAWRAEQAAHRPRAGRLTTGWLVNEASTFGAAAMAAPGVLRGAAPAGMGLGAGGRMRQEVYRDKRGVDFYEAAPTGRVFVHLVAATDWKALTGEPVPSTPVSAHTYAAHGLPWFDYYAADGADLPAADALAAVKSVGQVDAAHGFVGQQDDSPLPAVPAISVGDPKPKGLVADGTW